MKDSRDPWMTNRYPLIEVGMSRRDCADWWDARYDRPLERSACVACPFQSRQRWVETKRRWPGLFAEAESQANSTHLSVDSMTLSWRYASFP